MATGFEFYNANGKLALSSLNRGFKYLGTASKTATVQPTATSAGYSEFQITFSGYYLIAGIRPGTEESGSVSIRNISKSGSTWTIRCQIGSGTVDSNGFITEFTGGTVYCWGNLTSESSAGIISYDSNGNLLNDILQQGIYIGAYSDFSANLTSMGYTESELIPIGFNRYPILLSNIRGYSEESSGGYQTNIIKTYSYRIYTSTNGNVIYRIPTLETVSTEFEPGYQWSYSYNVYLPAQTIMFSDGNRFVSV